MNNHLDQEFTIGFAGDVMIGRLVNEEIRKFGYDYPWGDMLEVLQNTDINVINLETTLTASRKKVNKVFNFKANPDKVRALKIANIHVANLANNHILDFSKEGLVDTINNLDKEGIKYMGAGFDAERAMEPLIIKHKGVKIGFIGCTDNEPGWKAGKKPGTYFVEIGKHGGLIDTLKKLQPKVDVLVLSIHWGPNMVSRPFSEHKAMAHEAIENGVDIVHGHSAHIFQGIEIYRGKVIFYDTGDFVDDYMVDLNLRNDRCFYFLCHMKGKKVKKIELVPTCISDMQVNHADDKEAAWCLARMKELSHELGTEIRKDGTIDLGAAETQNWSSVH